MKEEYTDSEMDNTTKRQVEGLVKLLWSGIAVAGVLIALGIVLLLA